MEASPKGKPESLPEFGVLLEGKLETKGKDK